MDSATLFVRVGGIVIEVLVVVAAIVWAVSRIDKVTAVLNETVRGLKRSVDNLRDSTNQINGHVRDHGERLASLEAKEHIKDGN